MPTPQLTHRPRSGRGVALLAGLTIICTGAAPLTITQCDVPVLDAYLYAKNHGWRFSCGAASLGVVATFATYPPDRIGCQFKTLPVWGNVRTALGQAYLFDGSQTGRMLRNGWTLVGYDVRGAEWQDAPDLAGVVVTYMVFGSMSSRTYHSKLHTLTLSKPLGVCTSVIDQAF